MQNFSSKGYKILKEYNLLLADGSINRQAEELSGMKEEDIQDFLNSFVMVASFFKHLKAYTSPYKEVKISWRNVFNFLSFSSKKRTIDIELMEVLSEKINNIYCYTCRHFQLDSFDWVEFGSYLGSMLIHHCDFKSRFLHEKLVKYIVKQFDGIEVTLIELNDICTVVPENKAEKLTKYEEMRKSFMKNVWLNTHGNYQENLKNLFNNIWQIPSKIDENTYAFLKEKLTQIFDHIYENQLKPENLSWEKLGEYLFLILYHPYKVDMVELPQELINYIRTTFEWKRITVRKVDNKYTIVFAETSC